MKAPILLSLAAAAALAGCKCPCKQQAADYTRFVNPFIGSSFNGHTFPGACLPFGLVQASPDTGNGTWDYCSGYRYDDKRIIGFSQTHLSGTGGADLGDLLLQPFTGSDRADFASAFSKSSEHASPGYYAVSLDDAGADVEITATPHVAFYRFTYRKPGQARLLVDAQYGIVTGKDRVHTHVLASDARAEDATTLVGQNRVRQWVERTYAFAVKFDRPYSSIHELPRQPGEKAPRFVLGFDLKPGETLQVKVSMSSTDVAGAKHNLAAELPGWSFAETREAARAAWNRYLGRAEVLEGTDDQKVNFYTSLYHLFIQPNNIADVDGRYRGARDAIAVSRAPDKAYYSTYSLWDVFRAGFPLYTILAPERIDSFIDTMIVHQQVNGYLPVWTLWGKENNCMIGKHAVPIIVDAYRKGFRGFDAEAAFAAIRQSLRANNPGDPAAFFDVLDKYGYYPFDIIKGESVSRLLECNYDDWCASRLAAALGKKDDAAFFAKRALDYRNVFDKSTGLVRGRDTAGAWRTPFDPFELGHGPNSGNDYTEGNAWQYTWHVMQDPEGFIALEGGQEAFAAKLDQLFKFPSKWLGKTKTVDVTGLIGQYAHGNEPSHHVIYFFDYAGRPWRTQELVREVFDKFYLPKTDGLCGNDDCGQMSAWYLFSAMGFYPFNPCGEGYVLGAPQIAKIRLNLANGKALTVRADGLSAANKYVRSVELNGKPLAGFKLTHEQVTAGGNLTFRMSPNHR